MANELTIKEVEVDTCIGLAIELKDEDGSFQKMVDEFLAKEKVAVRVKINDVSKDFTFEEFKKRLGF